MHAYELLPDKGQGQEVDEEGNGLVDDHECDGNLEPDAV